jgi:hypothetical protein
MLIMIWKHHGHIGQFVCFLLLLLCTTSDSCIGILLESLVFAGFNHVTP